MKQFFKYFAIFVLLGFMSSTVSAQQVQRHGDLSVQGNKIVDEHGQVVSFAGPSLFWSSTSGDSNGFRFFTAADVAKFKSDWNATIIRAVLGVEGWGGFYQDAEANKARVRTVVNAAIANDMYVIIDWHDHHAEQHTDDARNFFIEMANEFGGYDNVIFEIYNEPLNVSWDNVIRPYAEDITRAIRNTGSDNLVLVGTRNWCQEVDEASANPVSDNNTAYSLHFYASDGGHQEGLRNKARTALSRNCAIFVTEWGATQASGDGYIDEGLVNTWMDFCKENDLSNCIWSVNDKSETASFFNPGTQWNGGWSDANLKQSGHIAKNIISNWAPIECTVKSIPSQIEAEDFCSMNGVKTEDCTEGGQNVGYFDAGDWVKYSVNSINATEYEITLRVATTTNGKQIVIETPNGNTTVNLPQTSTDPDNWQVWGEVKATVSLPAGIFDIALASSTGGFNINWINVEKVTCENPELASINLTPTNATIYEGQSVQLSATGINGCGEEIAINPEWSANAPNGLFTSATEGQYEITACDGDICGSVTITVIPEGASKAIPGVFEAEAYDDMDGIIDGGDAIGYLDPSDWIDYNVNVANSTAYKIDFKVANGTTSDCVLDILMDGAKVGSVTIGATGGWGTYSTYSTNVNLNSGAQTLRLSVVQGAANIDNITSTENDNPVTIHIEAEDYEDMSGIQTEGCSEGTDNIGWTDAGDWMTYEVTIPTTGQYTVSYRVAGNAGTGTIRLETNAGTNLLGTLDVTPTGGWQVWETKSHLVTLQAGTYDIGLGVQAGGFNMNWIEISGGSKSAKISITKDFVIYPVPVSNILHINGLDENAIFEIYNMSGMKVAEENGNTFDTSNLKTGVYFIKSGTQAKRFIKQ